MDFSEAVKRRLPLQVRLPSRHRPLEFVVRSAAEVFLVETTRGSAVVWLDPFWCQASLNDTCHIAYVTPRYDADRKRWIDEDPRYGPGCLAYQKPFVMEQLAESSPERRKWEGWQRWRGNAAVRCDRTAAWERVRSVYGELILSQASGIRDVAPKAAPALD